MLNQNSSSATRSSTGSLTTPPYWLQRMTYRARIVGRSAWTSRVISMLTNSAASGPFTWIWRSTATSHMLTCLVRRSYSAISPPSSGAM